MAETIYFAGRVLPDYASFSLAEPISVRSESALGQRLDTRLSIIRGRIAVRVKVPDGSDLGLQPLRYYAESIARAVVDSYGFAVGAAFDVDMGIALDADGGLAVFGTAMKELQESPVHADEVLAVALRSPYLQRALSDYGRAIQVPHDTAFHAYRAIESICEHFRAEAGCCKADAWQVMRSCLSLTKEELTEFKEDADKQRHGELIASVEENKRVETLRRVRDVLARFVTHLRKEAGNQEASGAGAPGADLHT